MKEWMQMIGQIYTALLLTIIIEAGIAYILKVRSKINQIMLLCINMITNPSLNIVLLIVYNIIPAYYQVVMYILEGVIMIVEGKFFYDHMEEMTINPYLLALIINMASFLIGKLII